MTKFLGHCTTRLGQGQVWGWRMVGVSWGGLLCRCATVPLFGVCYPSIMFSSEGEATIEGKVWSMGGGLERWER